MSQPQEAALGAALDALVGADPQSLASRYARGRATTPEDLGTTPRTRLLAVAPTPTVFRGARPIVNALTHTRALRVDKRFSADGTAGQDIVFGKTWYRFRLSVAPSVLDGQPTLLLSYAHPDDRNHWPVPLMFDELRTIADGLALGPTLFTGSRQPLFWFAMERG